MKYFVEAFATLICQVMEKYKIHLLYVEFMMKLTQYEIVRFRLHIFFSSPLVQT